MKSSYDEALKRLLVHEGGYTNHPSDPGGPTNFGITIADYRRYVKPDATDADVRRMSVDDAKAIYAAHYWKPLGCDAMPAGVDYCVFDYGVNSGINRALRIYAEFKDLAPIPCIDAICDERLAFLKQLRTWPVFGAGWGRRVGEVRAVARAMAAQTMPVPPPDVPRPEPKQPTVLEWIFSALVRLLTSLKKS